MTQRIGRNNPAFQWISTQRGMIPPNAVQGGCESDGRPLFVARALYSGSLIPGKVASHINGCLIAYDGKEKFTEEYEVLVGDAKLLQWKECHGRLQPQGWAPLAAGHEADGQELFIGKTRVSSGEVIGKVGTHFANGLIYGYDTKEKGVKETDIYYVLSCPES